MNRRTKVDEVRDALGGEIGRCALRSAEHAATLESIAERAFEIATAIAPDGHSAGLTRSSDAMRALVLQTIATIAELQLVAGRLAACAAMRAAEEAESGERAAPKTRDKRRK